MVEVRPLDETVRLDLAEQIGGFVDTASSLVESALSLRESIPVRVLEADAVERAQDPLRGFTVATGEWYHQVGRGDGRADYAATSVEEGDSHRVVEVARPAFAEAVAAAIERLDRDFADDAASAELLFVPSYYLVAVLLSGAEERVMVADRPERLGSIEVGYPYRSGAFLEALRRYPPSAGVPLPTTE